MDMPHLCTYSFTDGHLHCLYILATVNNGVINIHIQNFLFICFNFILRNGISGSYSNSIINVLSNWSIVWLHHFIFSSVMCDFPVSNMNS